MFARCDEAEGPIFVQWRPSVEELESRVVPAAIPPTGPAPNPPPLAPANHAAAAPPATADAHTQAILAILQSLRGHVDVVGPSVPTPPPPTVTAPPPVTILVPQSSGVPNDHAIIALPPESAVYESSTPTGTGDVTSRMDAVPKATTESAPGPMIAQAIEEMDLASVIPEPSEFRAEPVCSQEVGADAATMTIVEQARLAATPQIEPVAALVVALAALPSLRSAPRRPKALVYV